MNIETVKELRHNLHAHAEISCRETETVRILTEYLKANTNLEIHPKDGWLYAVYRTRSENKLPPIAFRADFDALPMSEGISLPHASLNPNTAHKCGHDGHAAALAGFGVRLEEIKPDRDVYLIFQYAEEIGFGGKICAELIDECAISEAYACHNWSGFEKGQVLLMDGCAQCASQGLALSFTGSPTHAGQPEHGHNPSAAVSELVLWLKGKNSAPDEPLVLSTIVGMKTGSKDFGMSASTGELWVTLRAEKEADLEALKSGLIARAKELCERDGLSVSCEDFDVFPETANHRENMLKIKTSAESMGHSVRMLPRPFRPSEDFGWYLKKCPGAIFYVGNGVDYPELHTYEYDFNDDNLQVIIDVYEGLLGL